MPLNAQQLNTATFAELLADTHRTAVHLEMRDVYAVGDEREDFETFLRTGIPNLDPARSFWPQWMPLVQDTDIRTWCAACGADDLIATARAVDSMYLEWRRLHRTGMRKVQQDWNSLHEQTRVCRVYVSNVPPGFFQTPGFATALMNQITTFQGTPNDVSEAVATRVARSRFLYEGSHRYVVLMEESVLATAPPAPTPCAGSCATSWP
ncbi:Scr1 family TA system antitoxin-like transcriptional regulator [Streptomyces sp. G7(2002)]|uniref:Scr1 family TA system antitoxin-like transcriptional regulator n=1 Tax=Streptomyces sp. G7(2002) TaxID=2971798 RepID=UPI00237EC010|nr:Scr1 family TA system antitoxin-like transcriptional regulator [Streptomyces sp. G7(2002)]WDT53287.1 Scr1 family TA system antitoxin-like transcriptional regulator [Streptomyces sp. G7(2002)]